MHKPVFIPAPFFLLRIPVWSIEEYQHLLTQENWMEALLHLYESHEWLREAIAIASPSLYQSLQKRPFKDFHQIAISLLNYTLRMATRTTPFGLFSFVATGAWGHDTHAAFELSNVHKRARPDMEWIYHFVQKLYKQPHHFAFLPVYTNPLAWMTGSRIFLIYLRIQENKGKRKHHLVSMNASKLMTTILSLTKEPIKIGSLYEKLKKFIPTLDQEKLYEVIQQLLSNQFLLPGIFPSLLSLSPFEELLSSLPDSKEIEHVVQKLTSYHQCMPGKGENQLLHLQQHMETIATAKTYLQVDAAYQGSSFQLPKEVGKEVEHALNLMWKISGYPARASKLQAYHAKFVEKYGSQRTVPLLELLHEEKGLGSFLNVKRAPSQETTGTFAHFWEKWLYTVWQECLREKKEEILISEKLIDSLFVLAKESHPDPKKALPSLDIFCKILAAAPEDITAGNFSLLFSQTTQQGCSTFGRFFDLLSKENQQHIQQFIHLEEQAHSPSLFVEISYCPSSVRSANVAIHPCFRKYRLDIEAKQQDANSLSLEDIYVGATLDRFYLTIKEGGCEIEACMGNLLNLNYAPIPLQFMREVTLAKHQNLFPFSWGSLEALATFLPRVRFQKTILSPATWKLNAASFKSEASGKTADAFNSWANQWNLPQHFLLVQGDQHLLLNRQHPAHLHEITLRLKKGESLVLMEHFKEAWIKSEKGFHASELVIPFTKNPAYIQREVSFSPPAYMSTAFDTRWKLPASEWLFIKFYLGNEGENRFLLQYLLPFAEHLRQEKKAMSWFFVRYSDPEPHLRFRCKLNTPECFSIVLAQLQEKSLDWMEKGLLRHMVLASYEREIERYGGPELIEMAENVFCADAFGCAFLLQAALNKQFNLNDSIFYPLSIISFLKDFGFDLEEILALLNQACTEMDQSELKGFREHKNPLMMLIEQLEKTSHMTSAPEVEYLKKASSMREQAINLFYTQATALSSSNLFSICLNMLHMHCNRLGCHTTSEKRALLFARQALIQIKYKHAKPLKAVPTVI